MCHYTNGNKKLVKINIMQANKGSSNLVNKIDSVMTLIKDYDIDILCLTEANYNNYDPISKAAIAKAIKGFKIEISDQENLKYSRCIMLIKNKIPYERINIKPDTVNPTVVIVIKTKKHEKLALVSHYRQWKVPGEDSPFTSEGIKRQLKRFEIFEDSVNKVAKEAQQLMLIRDFNVDQFPANNPLNRPEVKALQPVLERLSVSHGIQ